MNKVMVNVAGTVLLILTCGLGIGGALLLPWHKKTDEPHPAFLLLLFAMLVLIHEGLHAAGLRIYCRVPWRQIRFGFLWRALCPYCHCTVPVTVAGFRRMALLPLWVTGAATLAVLLLRPRIDFGILAGMAIGSCIGDVWVVMKLRPFPENLMASDSPTEIGCDIFPAPGRDDPDEREKGKF